MSLYWKSPRDGQCCECRPNACDPCEGCPSGESVELTLSGLEACCGTDNRRLTGLGAVNGVHVLERQESGDYLVELGGAVSMELYGEPDCSGEAETTGPYDVTIGFSCDAEGATLDIWMTDSQVRLFYAQAEAPSAGLAVVFAGAESCDSVTPYSHGGTATVE